MSPVPSILIQRLIMQRCQFPTTLLNGSVVKRIPFGGEAWEQLPPIDEKCDRCPARRGQYHLSGCASESCPSCEGFLADCPCEAPLDKDLRIKPKTPETSARAEAARIISQQARQRLPPNPRLLQAQLTVRSQHPTTIINGRIYERIRAIVPCEECWVLAGQFHHQRCCSEQCPSCRGALQTCSCDAPLDFKLEWN